MQLRQRDRTQKALFLELVPACGCTAPGDRQGMGLRPRGGRGLAGSSSCDSSAPMPCRLRSLGPCGPLSSTPHLRLTRRSYLFRSGSSAGDPPLLDRLLWFSRTFSPLRAWALGWAGLPMRFISVCWIFGSLSLPSIWSP